MNSESLVLAIHEYFQLLLVIVAQTVHQVDCKLLAQSTLN